jgi:hypothetical protein
VKLKHSKFFSDFPDAGVRKDEVRNRKNDDRPLKQNESYLAATVRESARSTVPAVGRRVGDNLHSG